MIAIAWVTKAEGRGGGSGGGGRGIPAAWGGGGMVFPGARKGGVVLWSRSRGIPMRSSLRTSARRNTTTPAPTLPLFPSPLPFFPHPFRHPQLFVQRDTCARNPQLLLDIQISRAHQVCVCGGTWELRTQNSSVLHVEDPPT